MKQCARYDSFVSAQKTIASLISCFGIEDFVILSQTNKNSLKYLKNNKDIFSMAIFPGAIFGDYNSILARSSADLILFNNSFDYDVYRKIANELGIDASNGVNFGSSQLLEIQPVSLINQRDIVFFEQLVAPKSFKERCYLLNQIVMLAKSSPHKKVWIKPRCKPGGRTIHKQTWHFERIKKILRLKFPSNLKFTYEPVNEILERTGLSITVSSTVAIESLARQIPTAIISDFGIRKDIHTASFVGSGCLATFDQLIDGHIPTVNSEWYAANVKIPDPAALETKLNELLELKKKGLLPKREIPPGAFSLVPDNIPPFLKKTKKLFSDPVGFCMDSRFALLKSVGQRIDQRFNA